MNYCPLLHIPEQLQWGHEKEDVAANKYYKKAVKIHKDLSISKRGLVINQQWPYLGASPDTIRCCGCHGKFLIECKRLFAKRNLLPLVAASDKLQKMPNADVKLKQLTSWYYQIQGQMAINEVGNTDLIDRCCTVVKASLIIAGSYIHTIYSCSALQISVEIHCVKGQ